MTDLDKMARELLAAECAAAGNKNTAAVIASGNNAILTRAAIDAIHAALLTAPTGWKLVPMEPDAKQIEEGAKAIVSWEEGSVWPDSWGDAHAERARREARKAYVAMVDEAPQPAQHSTFKANIIGGIAHHPTGTIVGGDS